ncbi:MAG: biotin/lipoyl-binding protein, partial [Methylovulum sp.]|nr:biotin/lipoyl-binding protein [Methylovulum sp.]
MIAKPLLTLLALCLLHSPISPADDAEPETEVVVKTTKVIEADLRRYVLAYGLVEPALASHGKAAASAKVATPVAGIITQVYCEEGEQVKKDAPLFALDNRTAAAQIAKAEVAYEFAKKN